VPGIFGLVSKQAERSRRTNMQNAETLRAMANTMRYESFYETRLSDIGALGIHVGWVGPSSMVSLSTAGQGHGVSAFVSGVPFCEGSHLPGRQPSGSLQIADSYLRLGERFLDEIQGVSAGVVVDHTVGQSLLFNDRFGTERIFLYEEDHRVLFSSEAKAILAVAPDTRSFDPVGLGQLMACGCTIGETSLFRGIRILLPGSVVRFVRRQPYRIRRYFDTARLEALEPLLKAEFLPKFCETLKAVVARYFELGSSAAVSLTGGLDSRMIMASLRVPAGAVPCYTFGSMYRETFDVRIARRVAGICGQPHKVLVLGEEFLSGFKGYLDRAVLISDGYLGFSGAAELYLNAMARGVAPLRITGNYGGELLRGVRALKCSIPKGEFIKPELQNHVERARQSFGQTSKIHPITFALLMQAPSRYGRYAIERSQVVALSPFLDKNVVELIYRGMAGWRHSGDPSVAVIDECRPEMLTVPTDRGMLGSGSRLAGKARRLYREAVFKLEYWTGRGMPDWLAKARVSGVPTTLEQHFKGRHKFQHFRTWLQRELAGMGDFPLPGGARSGLEEYIKFSRVEEMIDLHLRGKMNFTEEIDLVTTLLRAEALLFKPSADMPTN